MTTTGTTDVVADMAEVNGPEDEPSDWDAVSWWTVEKDVRRLRQRIFAASQAGDLKRVRNLQKLMLRSRANALVSVRRVTEVNAGRKTAGVDGKVVVSAQDKAEMASWVQHHAAPWVPQPVKRVYVPKKNGRRRPLGIPVIADRALQASTVNFPARGLVWQWLKAGVVENDWFTPTEEGTPQGGLCSATHNPPYEQRWVMRSVRRLLLVGAVAAVERCA